VWDGAAPAVPHWLYTGDTVRYDADGWIYFVDRGKDLIKRAGKNVAPAEIEAVIKSHPDVADCAVIGVPDAMSDERVVALVIAKRPPGESPPRGLAEAILAHCRGKLSAYKLPSELQLVAEFPRTSVGKVQKHLLRARWAGSADH
jgi:crotonobetaine/carnitine-CoA ligase